MQHTPTHKHACRDPPAISCTHICVMHLHRLSSFLNESEYITQVHKFIQASQPMFDILPFFPTFSVLSLILSYVTFSFSSFVVLLLPFFASQPCFSFTCLKFFILFHSLFSIFFFLSYHFFLSFLSFHFVFSFSFFLFFICFHSFFFLVFSFFLYFSILFFLPFHYFPLLFILSFFPVSLHLFL